MKIVGGRETKPAVEKNQRLRANNCIGLGYSLLNPEMTINEKRGAFLTSLTRVRFLVNAMTFFSNPVKSTADRIHWRNIVDIHNRMRVKFMERNNPTLTMETLNKGLFRHLHYTVFSKVSLVQKAVGIACFLWS